MHDLKFMLRTIGNLAAQDQNEEITSVIQNMKIRIGEMEEEFFCKNKVLNTILCEKKKEAIDNKINTTIFIYTIRYILKPNTMFIWLLFS